jgi:hypothetical protein
VVAVDVGPRSPRAGWDGVVVDRVGARGVLVADLDHHHPAYRVLEVFAVARADEDALFLELQDHAPCLAPTPGSRRPKVMVGDLTIDHRPGRQPVVAHVLEDVPAPAARNS